MTFLWPYMLFLLLFVPVFILVYLLVLRRKKKTAIRYASLSMVKEAMEPRHGFKRHIPPVLFLLGITTMIVAIARPTAMVTLPTERDTIVLAMDISGSMRAADVEPDRITASQEAAKAFINDQPRTTNIGVVAFAGTAMLVQQPTLDRETVLAAIDRFQLQRGTNIGGAILVSLQTLFPEARFEMSSRDFWSGRPPRGAALGEAGDGDDPDFIPVEPGSYDSAAIILLTDGQPTTGPDPVEAARIAADRGVRVFTVGFGSQDGEIVGFGGRSMRVQLDEETLRQVAEVTRGRYFHAGSASDLSEVYRELTTQFVMETQQTEITALFSAAAAIFILTSALLSLLWFSRII